MGRFHVSGILGDPNHDCRLVQAGTRSSEPVSGILSIRKHPPLPVARFHTALCTKALRGDVFSDLAA